MGIYLATMAPGLTWANGGSDGGDLITAAVTGGVAHPSGYPLYLLIARLFQFVPFGSLAFRTNLMSAVFSVLASVMVYGIVTRHLLPGGIISTTLAGMTAGYAFGLTPLIWSQAVIAEVYALQAFLATLIVVLYTTPAPASVPKMEVLDRWRGLTLGLATGNHLTTLLLAPLVFLLGSFQRRIAENTPSGPQESRLGNHKFDLPSLGRQVLGFAAGLSLYLTLPLRALADPPVNWGNTVSPDRLWWLVSGKLYQDVYLQFDLSHLWAQILFWMGFAVKQLGTPVILLGVFGLILYWRSTRLTLITLWIAVTSLVFASIYRPFEADVYLIPLLLSFSVWFGLGFGGLVGKLSQRSYSLGLGLSILMIGYVLVRPISYISQVDVSQDQRAEFFGREVLSAVPENSIVFAKGDQAVFALWYFHFALGERPDLTVLATDLLHYDWYQEVIQSAYPSLSLPDPFPYPETILRANPGRPICHVQYANRAEIECTGSMMFP